MFKMYFARCKWHWSRVQNGEERRWSRIPNGESEKLSKMQRGSTQKPNRRCVKCASDDSVGYNVCTACLQWPCACIMNGKALQPPLFHFDKYLEAQMAALQSYMTL